MEFKRGQKVIIIGLYNLKHDGKGTFVGPATDHGSRGKFYVDTENGLLPIESSRIMDEGEYWMLKKSERDLL